MKPAIDVERRERARLAFVEQRDGMAGARDFARQGIFLYRKALAQRNRNGRRCGYGQAYRAELVGSLVAFRRFLRDTA